MNIAKIQVGLKHGVSRCFLVVFLYWFVFVGCFDTDFQNWMASEV